MLPTVVNRVFLLGVVILEFERHTSDLLTETRLKVLVIHLISWFINQTSVPIQILPGLN